MRRRVLTKSFLNFQIEQCISLVHIVSRNRLEFILNMNNEEKKKRKHRRIVEQIADDTKRIADGTKQNKKRQK
ncbi:hypothetical protein T06_1872, partial [Trichinella sp. T6]